MSLALWQPGCLASDIRARCSLGLAAPGSPRNQSLLPHSGAALAAQWPGRSQGASTSEHGAVTEGGMAGTLLAVMVMVAGGRAQKTPSYSVVAPNTIRPNTDYYAAITMDGIEGDLQVTPEEHN